MQTALLREPRSNGPPIIGHLGLLTAKGDFMPNSWMLLTVALMWQPVETTSSMPSTFPSSTGQIGLENSVQLSLIRDLEVPAREAGVLSILKVQEGALVKAGQELGRLEDAQVQIAIRKAQAEYEIAKEKSSDISVQLAKKAVLITKNEYQRALDSIAKLANSVSQTDRDRARFSFERAELEVKQAEQDLRVAELSSKLAQVEIEAAQFALEKLSISSPLPGMVVEVKKSPGEWVNPGDVVIRMVQLDRLRVEGFLNAQQFGADVLNCPVTLVVNLPQRPGARFDGAIVFVSPEVEPVNNQFRFWAEIDNEDLSLRPGMHGSLAIHLDQRPATAPKSAPKSDPTEPETSAPAVPASPTITPPGPLRSPQPVVPAPKQ